jgi:hypothetical protein
MWCVIAKAKKIETDLNENNQRHGKAEKMYNYYYNYCIVMILIYIMRQAGA